MGLEIKNLGEPAPTLSEITQKETNKT